MFKGSSNILGILIRGTDYVARKPKHHPIPPKPGRVINDIKKIDKIYGYKWIFITTEDNSIREKFINYFEFNRRFYFFL